jgi:hypothetical protein
MFSVFLFNWLVLLPANIKVLAGVPSIFATVTNEIDLEDALQRQAK